MSIDSQNDTLADAGFPENTFRISLTQKSFWKLWIKALYLQDKTDDYGRAEY